MKHRSGFLVALCLLLVIAIATSAFVMAGAESSTTAYTGSHRVTSKSSASVKKKAATVYFTKDISANGLVKIYKALGVPMKGNTAVKISTGAAGDPYCLDPDLIGKLVKKVDGTIVECNTAYPGARLNTATHKLVIQSHGYDQIADVDIMDEDGEFSIPVTVGKHLDKTIVGADLKNYDSMLVLNHFKGHTFGGFGGAIKNMSVGVASSHGKAYIHSVGRTTDRLTLLIADHNEFLESMGEAAVAVRDYFGSGNIIYISVMNNLSVDCDCVSNPDAPEMDDVGILASTDPVALDQACVDLVYAQKNGDGAALVERIESRNGLHTLEYADSIGLGERYYYLRSID